MTQASPPQRTWFLKDEPLSNLQGQDRSNHNAYVNLLVKAIRELTPPFTLGVFGSWGVGKSSIANDLGDKLAQNSSDTRTATIDVWKYSDDSLRRQFLFDLQQDLHRQKALPKDRDYVQEVYEEKTEERPGQQRFDITRFRALAVPLILTLVLTYILNHPECLPDGYGAEQRGDKHWRVTTPGGKSHTVTTNRAAHDYAAGTVEFFGPGSPAFPETSSQLAGNANGSVAPTRPIRRILTDGVADSKHVADVNDGR